MPHPLASRRSVLRIALSSMLAGAWVPAPFTNGLMAAQAPAGGNRYHTRQSNCRHQAPPGTPLPIRRLDSGTRIQGYTAQRLLTYTADASTLNGGDILVCSEYGRVEITDSDDDLIRAQVRMEGYGEGSESPGEAARKVIAETEVRVLIDGGVTRDTVSSPGFRIRRRVESTAMDNKPVHFEVHAVSGRGTVNIVSVPAAPLPRR